MITLDSLGSRQAGSKTWTAETKNKTSSSKTLALHYQNIMMKSTLMYLCLTGYLTNKIAVHLGSFATFHPREVVELRGSSNGNFYNQIYYFYQLVVALSLFYCWLPS